jgi:hypothetical protein
MELREWHSALPQSVAAALTSAPGAAATAEAGTPAPAAPWGNLTPGTRACLPFLGHSAVGVRRLWVAPLREDAGVEEMLAALAEAGRACGLDAVHASLGLLLSQRISVPPGFLGRAHGKSQRGALTVAAH